MVCARKKQLICMHFIESMHNKERKDSAQQLIP